MILTGTVGRLAVLALDWKPRAFGPGLYLAALEALGVRAEEAIAFEDSPNGIRAAQAAGIFCVAVPNPITRQLPLDRADLQVQSPRHSEWRYRLAVSTAQSDNVSRCRDARRSPQASAMVRRHCRYKAAGKKRDAIGPHRRVTKEPTCRSPCPRQIRLSSRAANASSLRCAPSCPARG